MTWRTKNKAASGALVWAATLAVTSTSQVEASGAFVAPSGENVWKDVRRELANKTVPDGMSSGLRDVLERLETGTDTMLVVRLSYAIATKEDLQALDLFWTNHLAKKGNHTALPMLMEIRARALGSARVTRQTYLESWLYLARNGGNYDHCGGGNCGNGKGHGGGNGTGSEGHG